MARVILMAACSSLGICTAAWGATFNLPVGDAVVRLHQWSDSSGVQILFDFNVARFYSTSAVRGTMSPNLALIGLLKGTNLTFDWINDHTVAVMEAVPICRPYSGLTVNELPLPPCVQGPAAGEKRPSRL